MLFRKIPRTQQPQQAAGVDWSNPLCRELRALFDCRAAVELVHNNSAKNRSTLAAPSVAGMPGDFSGSANQQYAHRPGYAITGPLTILALMEVRSLSTYSAIVAKQASPTTFCPFELRLGNAPGGGDINMVRANGDYKGFKAPAALITAQPNVLQLLVVRCLNGLVETPADAVVNGVKTALSTGEGVATANCSDNGADVWLGRRSDGATQLDGRLYYVGLSGRYWSDAEADKLRARPWQLYAPAAFRLGVDTNVTFSRPNSDIIIADWAGTPSLNRYDNINDVTPSDLDFNTSPNIDGSQGPAVHGLSPALAVGTVNVRTRGLYVGLNVSQVRITLLDAAEAPVGVGAWQAVTASWAQYNSAITTSAVATKFKIEVQ
jgi:hypothetical protein